MPEEETTKSCGEPSRSQATFVASFERISTCGFYVVQTFVHNITI